MHRVKVVVVSLLSAIVAACASVPTQKAYDSNKSLALNLAEAGGIADLKDLVVSADEYAKIHSSGSGVVAGAGWAAANFATPAPGFSSGWGFGLGLLSMVRSTDVPAKHRQLVAWMPSDMAADPDAAQEKFRSILTDALEKTFSELDWQHEGFEKSRRESNIIVASFFRTNGVGCPDSSAPMGEKCIAGAYVQKPQAVASAPAFLGQDSEAAFFFKADAIYNGYVSIVGKGHSDVSLPFFYLTLSKHLPDWSYFYIPPKRYMKAHTEGNLDYPQVYYRGKMELFVKED